MHKRAYAVVRCLFVTFVYCVETAKDMAIVTMECEYETVYPSFRMVAFSMTLNGP